MSKINKSLLLDKYNLAPLDFLGSGMEAEVYAYDNEKVFKLHNNMSNFNKQKTLEQFYLSMDSSDLSYELPRIYNVFEDNDILVSIEKRIEGSNMQSRLPEMDKKQVDQMMETYLSATIELRSVKMKPTLNGFTLFNDEEVPLSDTKNWFDLLKGIILKKQRGLDFYFKRDVVNYDKKVNLLLEILSVGYKGDYSLIHGDFYPGNLLIGKNKEVTGLIDFGLLTMYGDNLFDVAIGWVCFDMYNALKADISDRYLNLIISTLGEDVRPRLYLYVLVYSVISANFYSHDCKDGHYQWCVKNLNNKEYWNTLRNFQDLT